MYWVMGELPAAQGCRPTEIVIFSLAAPAVVGQATITSVRTTAIKVKSDRAVRHVEFRMFSLLLFV
jgi:hypothetical protein